MSVAEHGSRLSIEICDPARRLPAGALELLSSLEGGTLVVPDRGVPVHPASVARLAAMAGRSARPRSERGIAGRGSDRPLAFVPEIPVASELGLPRYEPVLFWLPKPQATSDRGSIPRRLLRRLFHRRLFRRRASRRQAMPPELEHCERIALASEDEQIHYFADHFHAIHPAPAQVNVLVCNACNLHCMTCPYHSREIRPTHTTRYYSERRSMSWELLERIAAECGAMRLPVRMGNIEEPFMHPGIVEFVGRCRSLGVPAVHITTNGTLLTPDRGKELLEAGLTSLDVSLDAARPETYRRVRHAELAAVEEHVRTFLDIRRRGGFRCRVLLSFVRNHGVSAEEEEEFVARWLPESDGVLLCQLAEYEGGSSRFAAVHDVAQAKIREASGRWPCLNPWQEMYLLPDGSTYYCCETISKLAFETLENMGKLSEQGIAEIWRGEAFRALRRDLIRNRLERWPACQHCGVWMAHVSRVSDSGGRKVTQNMITEIVERGEG
jgi:pyruvate-formate lyase-activating enzyme